MWHSPRDDLLRGIVNQSLVAKVTQPARKLSLEFGGYKLAILEQDMSYKVVGLAFFSVFELIANI